MYFLCLKALYASKYRCDSEFQTFCPIANIRHFSNEISKKTILSTQKRLQRLYAVDYGRYKPW